MVKYVPDRKHGFGERPHYEPRELDAIFERLAVKFLSEKYGRAEFPFETEDLKIFIEEHVESLDQYADLTAYGPSVEGLTEFQQGGLPKVSIAEALHKVENRLRTTLAHEFGHVHLHAYLYEMRGRQVGGLLGGHKANAIYCKRELIVSAPQVDWLEWQAGYACSALLVPASYARNLIRPIHEKHKIFGAVADVSSAGQELIGAIAGGFKVSREAARVRLSVLGYLGQPSGTGSLF